MEEKQNGNPQSGRIERLTATWHALDKQKWVKIGSVILTVGALVVAGLHKGVPWYLAHRQ